MIGSAFMNRVRPGKQLADTQAIETVPLLAQLDGADQ
jgi:hypothetical protein